MIIPSSTTFSRVFNFANFVNFPLFTKIFQRNLLTRDMHTFHIALTTLQLWWTTSQDLASKSFSPKRYLQSSHCFADSWELEWMTVWQCASGLYGTPIVCCVCGVHMQWIYFNEIFKSCYSCNRLQGFIVEKHPKPKGAARGRGRGFQTINP